MKLPILLTREQSNKKSLFAIAALALFFSAIAISAPAGAQQVDVQSIVTQRNIPCPEVAFTSSVLIKEFHMKQQPDSLQGVLYFWEGHCGMQEPMVRALVLHMIETNTFYDDWYPQNLGMMLEDYKAAQEIEDFNNYYYDYTTWEYHPISPDFNKFTLQLANDLKRFEDISPTEMYFLEYYSNNFKEARKIARRGDLAGTPLDSLFREHERQKLEGPMGFLGLSGGMWIPGGNLAAVGTFSEIGITFESQYRRYLVGGHLNVAFSATQKTFAVDVANSLTDYSPYSGLAVGFDLGWEAASTLKTSLFLVSGFGARSILSRRPNELDEKQPTRGQWSLSPGLGVYIRHRISASHYMAVQTRYNFVNFENDGGTDLSGNIFTFGLIFGGYQ